MSISQAAVGVMSLEPLPKQEEAVVGVVNINHPWQHGLDDLIPWLLKSTQFSTFTK